MAEAGGTDRLDALEMRFAHQERAIDDLNGTVTSLWERIDTLLREVRHLHERLREAEGRAAAGPSVEPPPPHY